eukprot:m.1451505 g.1451505  ORF g.1451505 m.1451505 type:complete len:1222 (-) comp25116_c0_seq29:2538-6203(-)
MGVSINLFSVIVVIQCCIGMVSSSDDAASNDTTMCNIQSGGTVASVLSCLGTGIDIGNADEIEFNLQFGRDHRTISVHAQREHGLFAPGATFSVEGIDVTNVILGTDVFSGWVLPDNDQVYAESWAAIEIFDGDHLHLSGCVTFGLESLTIRTNSETGVINVEHTEMSDAEWDHRQTIDTLTSGRFQDNGVINGMTISLGDVRLRRNTRVQRDLLDSQTCQIYLDADESFAARWGPDALLKMNRAILFAKGRFVESFGNIASISIAGATVGEGLAAPQPNATHFQILDGYSAYLARGATSSTGPAPDRRPAGGATAQEMCQNVLFTHTSTFGTSTIGFAYTPSAPLFRTGACHTPFSNRPECGSGAANCTGGTWQAQNTMWVSTEVSGTTVSDSLLDVVTAHELGHAFSARHDVVSDGCGNAETSIMLADIALVSNTTANFSTCAQHSVNAFIRDRRDNGLCLLATDPCDNVTCASSGACRVPRGCGFQTGACLGETDAPDGHPCTDGTTGYCSDMVCNSFVNGCGSQILLSAGTTSGVNGLYNRTAQTFDDRAVYEHETGTILLSRLGPSWRLGPLSAIGRPNEFSFFVDGAAANVASDSVLDPSLFESSALHGNWKTSTVHPCSLNAVELFATQLEVSGYTDASAALNDVYDVQGVTELGRPVFLGQNNNQMLFALNVENFVFADTVGGTPLPPRLNKVMYNPAQWGTAVDAAVGDTVTVAARVSTGTDTPTANPTTGAPTETPVISPTNAPSTLAPTVPPTTDTPTTDTPTQIVTPTPTTAPTTVGDGRTANSDGDNAAQEWFKDNHDLVYYLAMGLAVVVVLVGCGVYNQAICRKRPPETGPGAGLKRSQTVKQAPMRHKKKNSVLQNPDSAPEFMRASLETTAMSRGHPRPSRSMAAESPFDEFSRHQRDAALEDERRPPSAPNTDDGATKWNPLAAGDGRRSSFKHLALNQQHRATRYDESPLSGDDEDDFVFENPGYSDGPSTEFSPDFPGHRVGETVDYDNAQPQADRPMVKITAMPHYTAVTPKSGRVQYDTADPSSHTFVPYDNPDPRTSSMIVPGRNGGGGLVDYDTPAPAAVDYDNPADHPRPRPGRSANRVHHSYHAGHPTPPPAYSRRDHPRAPPPRGAPPAQRRQQRTRPQPQQQQQRYSQVTEHAWAGPPPTPASSSGFVTVDPRAMGLGQARPRSARNGMDLSGRGNRGGAAARSGFYPSAGWG